MTQSLIDLINQKKQQIDASKRPNAKRLSDGRSRIRILPSWRQNGDALFWHDFGQHFIKDASGEVKAVYICVNSTFGKPCPICDVVKAAINSSGNDKEVEMLSQSRGGSRVLVNALHIDGPNPTTPEVFELPPTVFESFIGLVKTYQDEGVNILDLATGFDIVVERTGKGLNTKYTVQPVPKSTAVSAEVMTKIQDLDKYVAQENDQNKARALVEFNSIAGNAGSMNLLPPATQNLLDVEEDLTLQIPSGVGATTTPFIQPAQASTPSVADIAKVEEALNSAKVEVEVATEAVKSVTEPQPQVAPATTGTGDPELDAILAGL